MAKAAAPTVINTAAIRARILNAINSDSATKKVYLSRNLVSSFGRVESQRFWRNLRLEVERAGKIVDLDTRQAALMGFEAENLAHLNVAGESAGSAS